jgi:hypothetical protein
MMDPREPIDLPDDHDLGETRADHTTTWIAGAILLAVAVAAAILIKAFAS